jgi:multidrug efflux pump subunit AcrA (membrane-fusion protein)
VIGLTMTIVFGVLVADAPMLAHHSFAAVYDDKKSVTIEGTVVQYSFRNPHSFVFVEVPGANQQVQRFEVEWIAARQAGREGVTKDTLKAGDRVVVTGFPGRNADDRRVRMLSITRPADGWKWAGTF